MVYRRIKPEDTPDKQHGPEGEKPVCHVCKWGFAQRVRNDINQTHRQQNQTIVFYLAFVKLKHFSANRLRQRPNKDSRKGYKMSNKIFEK